jgi:phosphatidylserine/phosphatidylglycerophosphate/cardiolipin synthase-like enzyme
MQSLQPGRLEIGYYTPRSGTATEEPNKSHLKLTIVDEEIVVLGSGNMDRASWYTSQELGIAFFSKDLAKQVRETTMEGLQGRVKEYFP